MFVRELERDTRAFHNGGMKGKNRSAFAFVMVLLVGGIDAGSRVRAQDKAQQNGASARKAKDARTATEPAATSSVPRKLEAFVLLPEPKEMRTERSRLLPNAKSTVISAARETVEAPGVQAYSKEEIDKLGISLDTFIERARAAADRRLVALQPDFVRDDSGQIRYAVYRSDSPLMASLLMAPSLAQIFKNIFGDEIWAAAPDRNALYIFPPKQDAFAEFTADLRERYESNPYAASAEVFLLKAGAAMPRVIGTFEN